MTKTQLKGCILLLITALIWGAAFVAQDVGADSVGVFTFNCSRALIGGAFLIPVCIIKDKITDAGLRKENSGYIPDRLPFYKDKSLLTGGVLCGLVLFFAMMLQQIGISYTTGGKAAFITSLYIIFVPVVGLLLGRHPSVFVWISILIAALGMFLLCAVGESGIGRGDIYVFLCSICYAAHILVIDHFAPKTDGVKMSCIQFFTVFLISLPCMLIFEGFSPEIIIGNLLPILFLGIMSSGVAYTLQIVGQKYTPVAEAPIIMSLESVFGVLSDAVLLHTRMSANEIIGCMLIFGAVILAQTPVPKSKKTKGKQ